MILDLISRLPLYRELIPGADRIAAAFHAGDPSACCTETREKQYAVKPDEKRRFEVHGHTIDLMMAREGAEVIHLCPMDQLSAAEALPGNGDGCKMNGAPQGSAIVLEKSWFCAIFPGEAHMVGGKVNGLEGEISKWVVKVPAPSDFIVEVNHG